MHRETGVVAFDEGSAIALERFVIDGVAASERSSFAAGLSAYFGATIDARRFVIPRSAVCGADVGPAAQIDLHDGEVVSTIIDSSSLPVPEAASPIEPVP